MEQIKKIIIDTNLWISLLIGKKMSELKGLCNDISIKVFICNDLIEEFVRIASRDRIKKYVTNERIEQTLQLMQFSCIFVDIENKAVSTELRDPKDLYLLSLAETIEADYILTGDKDLLTLKEYKHTKILTYNEFAKL